MKNRIFLLIFALSYADKISAQYLLPKTRKPVKSLFYIHFETQNYYSHFNYTSDGQYAYIYDDQKRRNWIYFSDYILAFSYSPTSWIEFYPYVTAQTHYSYPYLLPFQLNNVGLKLKHSILTSIVSLFPEIDITLPVDPQSENPYRIITNDDVFKWTGSVWLYFFRSISPFVRLGFQKRYGGLSSFLLWQLGLSYQDHIWELGFLFGGFRTIVRDVDQNNPNKKHARLNKFNSGSLKFSSVNPEATGFSSWVSARVKRNVYLFLNCNFDFQGRNYAQGLSINLGFKYNFRTKKSKKKYKKSIRRFREREDDVESIFNEDSDIELMQEIENFQ